MEKREAQEREEERGGGGGHIFFFGDQTNDFIPGLRQLLRDRDSPILSSFLERTHVALRREMIAIAQHWHGNNGAAAVPRFSSIRDIFAAYVAEKDTDRACDPVLISTLTTIYQLGSFIRYYGDGCRPYPPSDARSMVLGMCTGQLAACAVASASSIGELVQLAIEAVVLALRTGLHVARVRDTMGIDTDERRTWSYVVPTLRADVAASRIEQFSQSTNIAIGWKPFIGTVTPLGVTIFGPPGILEAFIRSPIMSDVRPVPAPIFAPYHNSILHADSDIEDILQCVTEKSANMPTRLQLISTVTGEQIQTSTFRAAVRTALEETLKKPLLLDQIIQSVKTSCGESAQTQWVISLVGTTSQILPGALQGVRGLSVRTEHITSAAGSDTVPTTNNSGRPEQAQIAIIGYSGRFPEAANPDSLWTILQEGRDVHREIPADRFDVNAHHDPTGKRKNTSKIRHGCFINEPGVFDARFFNISPREADQSDPAQRLALMTAYEALEMAGVVPDRTPSTQRDRVGVFYGMTSDDWREVNAGQDVGTYYIPGTNRAFTPGRINYFFKFTGPSVNVDTACSSSAAAIHLACNSLWRNDCDTAIAGGTNVMTNPDNFSGLDKGHFLCPSGNCKTFDDGADGYCRADAVGTIILKRLEDALADKDPIQAIICGAYTNHSAEAESITRPNAGAQAAIFRRILSDAGRDPLDVSYIEMHGTGTQAGDATEMKSVLEVFGGNNSGRSAERRPLYLGSVKANLGHAESGSGVTSVIKVMMMMKHGAIPPHIGIKTKINSKFPLDLRERGILIATKATPWEREANANAKRVAFVNNFSAAGGNSALLLEDAPDLSKPCALSEDPRTSHVVTVTARSARSLRWNTERLAEHLKKNSDISLASLAYTSTTRRMHHNYRLSVTGGTINEVRSALDRSTDLSTLPITREKPNVVLAFTGQGSVYPGMGRDLFVHFAVFRSQIQLLATIGESFGFDPFLPVILAADGVNDNHVMTPQSSQLALTCFQIALARLWNSFGVAPAAVVGHSLGEYAALHLAGVLSARDVVFLVGTRARIMEERCSAGTHAMLAVKAAVPTLSQTLQDYCLEVACVNGPNQTVLAGLGANVESARKALLLSGIQSKRLTTEFAFHSSQVDPVLDEFKRKIRGIIFGKPTIPILSPLLKTVVSEPGQLNAEYLARHCRGTVDLVGVLESARSCEFISDNTIYLEIGPVPFVTGMVTACLGPGTRTAVSARKTHDIWQTLSEALSTLYQTGLDIQWGEYHRDFDTTHEIVPLPAYAWELKTHWIQYQNNWCLTKGEKLEMPGSGANTPPSEEALTPQFLSPLCQKVLESEDGPTKSFVLVESDLSHPDLRAIMEAHKVNGVELFPSSAYASLAMCLGKFMYTNHSVNPVTTNTGVEVADMATTKPLLMRTPGKSELFRASAEADWASQTARVAIYSVDSRGQRGTEHATCKIRFGEPGAWMAEWRRSAHLVRSRMRALRDAAVQGNHGSCCHLIKRGMAYKLFENCVEYGENFRGLDEVYVDSDGHEATARVVFGDKSDLCPLSPGSDTYLIDGLGHLSGFVMNAAESFDYKAQVFLNHGWESMRCAVQLSPEETYHSYVKMESSDGIKYVGDVYIFNNDDSIVSVNQGVAFQAVPRKVLDFLLPRPSKEVPGKRTIKPMSTPTPMSDPPHSAMPPQRAVLSEQQPKKINPSLTRPPQESIMAEPLLTMKTIQIISEETGVAVAEMQNDLVLTDVGVDSLLSLSICGRFREELDMEVSPSLFFDYPTVRDLKRWIRTFSGSDQADTTDSGSKDSSTPRSRLSSGSYPNSGNETPIEEVDEEEEVTPWSTGNDVVSRIIAMLAEEIGVSVEDVRNAQSLAELGLDSLMSLTFLGRLREEANVDLPADILFLDNMALIQEKLTGSSTKPQPQPRVVAPPASTPPPHPRSTSGAAPHVVVPPATSVVVQGNVNSASKILFLFPDGSGSATAYAGLPRLSSDIAVVALNCPYVRQPQDMKCGLQDLTAPYLAQVRRRQPRGPYYLGGWSAGGISAYDAAAVLTAEGEEVAALVLLDSPNPIHLEKLPVRMFHFLNSVGVFGSGSEGAPEWLLQHFIAFLDALSKYDIKPFAVGKTPPTVAIWAADGVYKSTNGRRLAEQPDDTREMKWLLNERREYGPNGWDEVIERGRLKFEVLQGANHFTMMEGPQGHRLSQLLAKAMGS
ncbi:polyketide synthase for naphthopyrone YWA1 [Xylariaceae sp. AK1471]|nr:polyketide synthase for naphthopyrone YWA1 [Xylariaceae sp. AK1471]